tara:strand:+ start:712 stop:1752 length:1041 start_codon:yes stop_codon:yes gene_type:complete
MAYTTIDNPALFFNTVLYAGSNSSQSVTGVGFQPDWVWIKNRDASSKDHKLHDRVRGSNKSITTNNNATEQTYTYFTSFDSDGFTLEGNVSDYNQNSSNFVSWNWLAGGSTSSNGNGSITSTVSVNSTSGFSIVSYVGGGASSATVGHGLGVTPAMIIIKNRENDPEWRVWHQKLSGSTYKLGLNSTGAQDSSATVFNGQSSTTFTVGSDPSVSGSGNNIIAYCFAEVKGFSKFGSYTGNGNADGVFVYTGFRPAWVMIKQINSTGDWMILDNKRDTDNGVRHQIYANSNSAESVEGSDRLDFLSNGIKHRSSGSRANGSSDSYIYMAFAEHPFVTEGTKAAGTAR